MPFNRELNEVTLRELARLANIDAGPNWWKELLTERFTLGWKNNSGHSVVEDQPLYIAVRDGYLNAYIDGQSVLKFSFLERDGQTKLNAEIHWKYVFCDTLQRGDYLQFDGTSITGLSPQGWDKFIASSTLEAWVKRAQMYAGRKKRTDGDQTSKEKKKPDEGREKQGVAVIVAKHPQIIDVEMALPSGRRDESAPRMDIVSLNESGEGAKIAFYEAKLFSNPELRNDELKPKVLQQLLNYREWINVDGREEEVVRAYRRACRIYMQINGMRKPGSAPPLHPLIEQAADDGSPLTVDRNPSLVIFGYKTGNDLVSPEDPTWVRHEKALREKGIRLIMKPRPEDIVLA